MISNNMKDILTLQDVSDILQLSNKTVLKMVKSGEIPCAKIANQWRFPKVMLNEWITTKMEKNRHRDLTKTIEGTIDNLPISRFIDTEYIIPELQGAAPSDILNELSAKAYDTGLVVNKDELLKKLKERESLASTSIGQGIALPHLRKPDGNIVTKPSIIIGKSLKGIDFYSFDSSKTEVFILILADSEIVHLKLLSKLTQFLTIGDNIETLKLQSTPEDFLKFFIQAESSLY